MSTPIFIYKINDFYGKVKKRPNGFSFKNYKYMSQKNYSLLAGIIFGWSAVMAGWSIPIWINWTGLAGAGFMSWQGLKLGKK